MAVKVSHPKEIFKRYLPEAAVDYCYQFWVKFDFELNIKKKRNSKLGDYRYDPNTQKHAISVNADLNPFAFLITYLHEVAHLTTHLQYGYKAEPHGKEWKHEFYKIAAPMLVANVFPVSVLAALNRYFENPKATSCSDLNLMKALHAFDPGSHQASTFLSDVSIGKIFDLNGKIYAKEENRRTRVICRELATGRRFLISKTAKVNTNFTNQ